MYQLIWLDQEGLASVKLVFGIIALKAGTVGSFPRQDTVDQKMIPHPGTKGVIGTALLISILIQGQVKIVIIQKKIIFHGKILLFILTIYHNVS